MADRPLGISLTCAFFGLVGLVLSLGALFTFSRGVVPVPSHYPASVRLFLHVVPVYMLLLGLLGLYVAAALWSVRPSGRRAGLAWIVLWLGQEALIGMWGLTGPEVIQEAGPGLSSVIVRFVVGGAIFHYLWTTGAKYVDGEASKSRAPTISSDR